MEQENVNQFNAGRADGMRRNAETDAVLHADMTYWATRARDAERHSKESAEKVAEWHGAADAAAARMLTEEAARIRAEVRASEWEAIARELIARGAGRPKPEQVEKPESPLAKKIREESGGDPMIQAHYWKNVVAPARAAGKKDEEIADLIGWETQDPPAQ